MKKRYSPETLVKRNRWRARWVRNNPGRVMWYRARYRANRDGIPFDIVPEDVVVPSMCPVLGIPIRCGEGAEGRTDNSPSLDRIDSTKGYVRGNVQVVCMRANRIKNDATLAELKALVAHLEKHHAGVA